MTEIDRIFEELASISERLAGQDVTPSERIDLGERRRELRLAAERLDTPSRDDLTAELRRLEEAWDGLQRQRIDVVKQAGDLAAGNFGFTSEAMRLNRAIDKAGGRDGMEKRIKELRALLTASEPSD